MQKNPLKLKWAENKPTLGIIAPNTDPTLVESIGLLGFDFYMIDAEHGPASAKDAENLVRACEVVGTVPLARIRSVDPKLILQFLDAGVMGVMMPGTATPAEVREFLAAVKYPPVGNRGLGPVRAARNFWAGQTQAEYVTLANSETLVLPQIESLAAVKNLDDLCKIEGVDGFIIGPRDLAMDMGFIDGPGHPEVAEMMDHIFKTILEAGLIVGTVAGTGAKAQALVDRGVRLILNSVNGLLKVGATQFFKDLR